jgi:hypothetical protein
MRQSIVLLLALIIGIALFAGCSGEKPSSDSGGETSIIGVWEYQYGGETYEFREDGTGVHIIAGYDNIEFTYETDEKTLSLTYTSDSAMFKTEYSVSGNTLNVKEYSGNDMIYTRK